MLPLKWIMAQRPRKECPTCGGLLRVTLEWLDRYNFDALNIAIPKIWGTATLMRMVHPDEEWLDPVWESAVHLVRQGREGYSDEARGYEKRGLKGDRQLLKIVEKVKANLDG